MKARSTQVEVPTVQPHLSRIVRITNLGLQEGFEWEGKMIEADYKLEFVFEITDENMKDGRPFWVSKEINNKDSDKSTLYSWMLAAGTDCNNVDKALGQAVMMTPKIKTSGWPTVDNVAGLPPSMQANVDELRNEAIFFDFTEDTPDMDAWAKLPEKTQEKVLGALDVKDYPAFYSQAYKDEM
jgi:hypothetical protein